MTQKEYIKFKAEKMAEFLGFDTKKINLTLINILEMYCQGYAQALEDLKDGVEIKPEGVQLDKSYDDENPNYIRNTEDGI